MAVVSSILAVPQFRTPTPLDPAGWVDAAPFRAHVRHVMAAGDVSVEVVAHLAGVSPRIARHLVDGRGGRRVRRISPYVAQRLFGVTVEEVRAVAFRAVPAVGTALRMRRMLAAGWTYADLCSLLGIRRTEVAAIVREQVSVCTQLVSLRVAAAAFELSSRSELLYHLPERMPSAA